MPRATPASLRLTRLCSGSAFWRLTLGSPVLYMDERMPRAQDARERPAFGLMSFDTPPQGVYKQRKGNNRKRHGGAHDRATLGLRQAGHWHTSFLIFCNGAGTAFRPVTFIT